MTDRETITEDPYCHKGIEGELINTKDLLEQYKRIKKALYFVERFGGIDGDHHKQWLITQMTKALLGSKEAWEKWELEMRGDPEDEFNYYGEWDEGIAP